MDNIMIGKRTLLYLGLEYDSTQGFAKVAAEVLAGVARSESSGIVQLPLDQALAIAQVAATLHLAKVIEDS